jgi:hypothetical protein
MPSMNDSYYLASENSCLHPFCSSVRNDKYEVVSDTHQFNIFPLPFYLLGISNSNPKGVLRPQAGGEA